MGSETRTERRVREFVERANSLHGTLADAIGNPDRVWCRQCGASQPVDAAAALRNGWPKCCGCTMTIDQPTTGRDDERTSD